MRSKIETLFLFSFAALCAASFHEQYRVPSSCSDKYESYVFEENEYLIQNLPVSWENAKILCRGHHNSTMAILDTKEKAEFLAEALSESQFQMESVWVGARRGSAEDPAGYRWSNGLELRRTELDVMPAEKGLESASHYPLWLNRTRVPVPEGGADCAALERASHDRPVFVDLPCGLERPFVCERKAEIEVKVRELKTVRCRSGLYRVYDGRLDWHQAAAYCVINKMALANIATMKCLKKLGLTMLKSRPSIETAWVGARGSLGRWTWVDSGASIFEAPPYNDAKAGAWPPMRDLHAIKQDGCLQLDRHEDHPPVFMEARCERKMQFICYQDHLLNVAATGAPALRTAPAPPSDDLYYYVLVRQLLYWQHAFENCRKMNGSLASVDSHEILVQLLLVMGENKEEPVTHIWISGRLNMTKDVSTDAVSYAWMNPANGRRVADHISVGEGTGGTYVAPWLDEEFTMDSPCLNLDRVDHLSGLVYGLPCDTPQASVCVIEKAPIPLIAPSAPAAPPVPSAPTSPLAIPIANLSDHIPDVVTESTK